jgi:hypothetical protein
MNKNAPTKNSFIFSSKIQKINLVGFIFGCITVNLKISNELLRKRLKVKIREKTRDRIDNKFR